MEQEEQKQDIDLNSDEQANEDEVVKQENLVAGDTKTESKDMLIMAVLAVVVVVLALVYMWGISAEKAKAPSDIQNSILPTPPEDVPQADQVSTSDEIVDIEKDINSTDIDNIDAELDQIESDLNSI